MKGDAVRHLLMVSCRTVVVFTLLTGVAYPALITGMAAALFPRQAGGSLIGPDDRPVGSAWLGQPFHSARYFWSRPSATTPEYNAASSSASQWGPTSPALDSAVRVRIATLRASGVTGPIPVDLVTGSGSGLDPDISPAAASIQIARVARARRVDSAAVGSLVVRQIQARTWGILGEPRINVLALNLALDRLTQ